MRICIRKLSLSTGINLNLKITVVPQVDYWLFTCVTEIVTPLLSNDGMYKNISYAESYKKDCIKFPSWYMSKVCMKQMNLCVDLNLMPQISH